MAYSYIHQVAHKKRKSFPRHIITPRSSNLVENVLFYGLYLIIVMIWGICSISRVPRHDNKLMAHPENDRP